MIQAKPQIRSLSADVTRFVPSIVKQRKDDVEKPKRHEYQIGQSQLRFGAYSSNTQDRLNKAKMTLTQSL